MVTTMELRDAAAITGTRRTADGYLVAEVRAARTGIQTYTGAEVGRPDLATVRVYRPPEAVFAADALQTFAFRPVTVGHPAEPVGAGNWRDVAVGNTGGEVVRDGEFVRVPLVLMDAAAIAAVEGGLRELSMGYSAEIVFGDGKTPEGEAYDAVQKGLRMNHLAVVAQARGGAKLRIGDDQKGSSMTDTTKTVVLGDKAAQVTPEAATIIEDWKRAGAEALAAKDAELADAKKAVETKDGEIAALKAKLADAAMTPEKLASAVKARTQLMADAAKVAPALTGLEAKTDAEVRRAVVDAKLGEAAKGMTDEAIAGAFSVLAASGVDPVRGALRDGGGAQIVDRDAVYVERNKMYADRHAAAKKGA